MRAGQCQAWEGEREGRKQELYLAGVAPADDAGLGEEGLGKRGVRMGKEIFKMSQTPGKEKGVTAQGNEGTPDRAGLGGNVSKGR